VNMEKLTPEQWQIVQDALGWYARETYKSALYRAQPVVGSVHDAIQGVRPSLPEFAAIEEVINDYRIKAGAEAAPF